MPLRVTVSEPSREARVSKIRVPDKDQKCQESRRVARDEQPGPGTHCKAGLEHSLASLLSQPTRVFKPRVSYVALVRSDILFVNSRIYV